MAHLSIIIVLHCIYIVCFAVNLLVNQTVWRTACDGRVSLVAFSGRWACYWLQGAQGAELRGLQRRRVLKM